MLDVSLLVVLLDRAADLDGGPLVHGGHSAHLQLHRGLARVGLDEVLVLLGLDLRVRDVETLVSVALLLQPGPRLPALAVRPVDGLAQREELLALHLPQPPPAPAPGGALGPGPRLPGGRAVHHGTELLGLGRGLGAGGVLQLDDVVVAVCPLLDTVDRPGLGAPATGLGAGGEVRDVPSGRTGVLIAGPDLDLQSPPRVTEVRGHGALLGGLHADDDGLL